MPVSRVCSRVFGNREARQTCAWRAVLLFQAAVRLAGRWGNDDTELGFHNTPQTISRSVNRGFSLTSRPTLMACLAARR